MDEQEEDEMHVNGYSGQHSITMGDKNTWDDWKLIPESRPLLAVAQPKTNFIEIPGADGTLDYTEVLSGLHYHPRSGSWSFIVVNDYMDWYKRKQEITNYLQGKSMRVIFSDDPEYYITCRLAVNEWQSDKDWSRITIDYYAADPWKYSVKGTADYDWLWNELFDLTIYYGRFYVDGQKYRNLINPTDDEIEVSVKCSSKMIYYSRTREENVTLKAGNTSKAFKLSPGNNLTIFKGNGLVSLDYGLGRVL